MSRRFVKVLLLVSALITTLTVLLGCAAPPESASLAPTDPTAPTKFARLVPSPTLPPTRTPTAKPSATLEPTRTRTRTPTSLPKPTHTPLPVPTATVAPRAPALAVVLPDEKYGTLSVIAPARAPHLPATVNLSARGYVTATARLALVDIDGPADPAAPRLITLFADNRAPTFAATYQLDQWDEDCNCRGAPITDPAVTMASLAANPGEVLRVPESGYNIGEGYNALVLYADADRIAFTYTREDNPARGYVLYLEGIAVEPNLVALYQWADRAGRGVLPALRAGQGLARARGNEVKFAIRDAGAFMDPRSRKDWWRGI